MKIAWLCPYPIQLLRGNIDLKESIKYHSASWIVNLSEELVKDKEIELHIITLTPHINKDYHFTKNNIHFHIIRRFYKMPLLNKGFPKYLPIDFLTGWYLDKSKLNMELKKINPDITHIHGTEGIYGISSYSVKKSHLITIQGIANEYVKYDKSCVSYPMMILERKIIKKYINFGNRTEFGHEYITNINHNACFYYTSEAINRKYFEDQTLKIFHSLVYVGDISERKNIKFLIDIISLVKNKINDIRLYLIGDGSERYIKEVKAKIDKNNLNDNIILLGTLAPESIIEIYKKSTIFVFPTKIDNSPNSLLEAMASGLVCIASNIGGIPSIIKDHETGFLFNSGDSNKLSNIIIDILERKIDISQIISKAKKFTKEYYFPSNVANMIKETYKEIILKNESKHTRNLNKEII